MKANPTYLLDSLSNNDVTFFIPPYQRNYEWTIDTCKVLYADALRVSRANGHGAQTEHFFGSIVYVVEDSGFGLPDRYILTDGQQRITTTMLLLMAMRDTLSDEGYAETIQRKYIENERSGQDTEYKVKLKQVESDWEAYRLLALRHPVPAGLKDSSVYRNYLYFYRTLSTLDEPEAKALLEKGLTKFSTISIQLEPDRNPWENPQEIFESMNSLGQPLSFADLVRNFLLMGKSTSRQETLYNEFWLTLEKRLPNRLSEFLRDWMQVDQHRSFKVARESNYKELYSSFKEVVQERSVEALFEGFVKFCAPYAVAAGIDKSGTRDVDRVLADLNIIGVAPAYSYLAEALGIWEDGLISNARMVVLLVTIRTYLLRRRVLGITQAENKFFPSLGSRLPALTDSEDLATSLCGQLASAEYALRLPNDEELRSRLYSMNFYNLGRSKNYPRLLLSLIEEHLTKSRPAWDDPQLQLEHIMPQTLSPQWKVDLGDASDEVHQSLVNNLGNITLIRHNQELGNRPFREKKAIYLGSSGLQVAQNSVLDAEVWNEASIIARRSYLTSIIIDQILAVPEPFKRGSNWQQSSSKNASFDSRHVLNQLIGEVIVYEPNDAITARIISDSQVEFEGGHWNLTPLTKELKGRGGEVSRASNFHGPAYWSWKGIRLVDLDI